MKTNCADLNEAGAIRVPVVRGNFESIAIPFYSGRLLFQLLESSSNDPNYHTWLQKISDKEERERKLKQHFPTIYGHHKT